MVTGQSGFELSLQQISKGFFFKFINKKGACGKSSQRQKKIRFDYPVLNA